ncbi:MAG: class II aldolase and adducin N-terminal domain-containing protein [Kiloniellales bacterium]|nr:class II aldolase and adducin N-terminal domain-containing protein [Kiloniellales bacterium]
MPGNALHALGIKEDPYRKEREELAAVFRWIARLNMHEGIANHFSLSVSDDGTKFLINPRWMHFSRIKASDLLLLDANDPATMEQENAPDPTAWGLHGTIHRRLPAARAALHVHSKHVTVLAALKESTLPPIDQNTMRFFNRVVVDESFGGLAFEEEAERACKLLGNAPIMMMGNHGVMVTAPTIAQAFDELYYFERAAETAVTAYMTGKDLRRASDDVAERTCEQWLNYTEGFAEAHLREVMAILDEDTPDYRD